MAWILVMRWNYTKLYARLHCVQRLSEYQMVEHSIPIQRFADVIKLVPDVLLLGAKF